LAQVESVKEETRKMGIAVRSNKQAIEKATEETQELTSTNNSLVTQVEQVRSERDGTARHLKETLEELQRERTQRLDASSKWIEDARRLKQELETAQEALAGARSDVDQLNRDLCAVNSCLKNEKRVKVLYKKRCVDTEQARKRITSKYAARSTQLYGLPPTWTERKDMVFGKRQRWVLRERTGNGRE
jgi:chromosome segregation ATPase